MRRSLRVRRLVAGILTVGGIVAALLAGCAKKRILAVGNLPPETSLFVSGSLDTVNHVVQIFWFGSDPDGEVRGFELRFKNPAAPGDTNWVSTTRTDSTFTVPTPTGYAMPVFEVRALDDQGVRDPSPARQDFQFSNQAPVVTFTNRLRTNDTTYASVTLDWTASDPDGDAAALRFLVGLDTIPATLHLVSGNRYTVDTTDFKIVGAYPPTRPRMAFIRAIDDGGRASAWDSVRWVVRAPSTLGQHPQLLLIDDVPRTNPANGALDALYSNAAQTSLPAGSFSVLRLDFTQPFRSTENLIQTCRLFDAVVWYRGTQSGISFPMRDYQDGLAAYLDGGGRLMIESLNLIVGENATGALRADWVTRYLGSSDLIRSPIAGRADSTVDWSARPSHRYYPNAPDSSVFVDKPAILRSPMFQDSLGNPPNTSGLRGFAVRDTSTVAIWARDSTLSPQVPRDIPVAVSVPVPEGSTGPGRVIVVTLPIRAANGFVNTPRFLCKIFRQMGLGTGPCP